MARTSNTNIAKTQAQGNTTSVTPGGDNGDKAHLTEEWDEIRYNASIELVDNLRTKISSLRLLAPDLIRTFSLVPSNHSVPETGLPSPPGSPVLRGVEDSAFGTGSPQAVYQKFEEQATRANALVKEIKAAFSSQEFKNLQERCKARGEMKDLESGWALVVGQPRWMHLMGNTEADGWLQDMQIDDI